MSNVPQVTAENFDAEVLQSSVPVLVDFYGDYCPPCRMMAPILDQLSKDIESRAKVVKVDVATEGALAQRFKIELIPTLIVFDHGHPTSRRVGMASRDELLSSLGV